MSQQYVLLRKENDLLNSLIGQSFNQKSKFEAEKILDEIHSKAQSRMIGKKSLCYIIDKNEIKGVGGSTLLKDKNGKIISNLILDQFGLAIGGLFKGDSLSKSVTLKDKTNTDRPINIISSGTPFVRSNGARMTLQVGSGSTPPIRSNFFLQTIFGTAPESISFVSSNPVYNSGLGNFKNSGSINAGGSGTINESVLIANWINSNSNSFAFVLFRDIISPAQSFIAGQTIALEYTIQL